MLIQPELKKMEWGELKVILSKKYERGASIEAGVFRCEAGKSLQLHTHEGGDEYCWVVEGTAIFVIDGKEFEVKSGELIKIPKDLEHRSFPKGAAPFTSFFIVCP
jgi:mannose-6-phosphate isomerase-like protein (cupin superfamily)